MEIALVVALALYNNIANLIPAFNGALYVPLNCLAAGAVVIFGVAALGLTREEIGLDGLQWTDLLTGLALGLALTAPLYAALMWRRTTALLADKRVAGLSGGELAYQTLLRIPVGTALLEEIAFRGVLFGALSSRGDLNAGVISSIVFGLWHISPTLNLVRANRPDATVAAAARTIAGAVVLTALAGGALVWLRVESGGLLAPWALHAALNSSATVAAVLAHRRLGRQRNSLNA